MATTILECARCGNTFENYNPKARRKYCPDCSSIAQSEAKARWYRERHPLYRVDYKYIAPSKDKLYHPRRRLTVPQTAMK